MEIINDCSIPLQLSEFIRQATWPSSFPFSAVSRLDREAVYQILQHDLYSIDILGADTIRSIYRTADAGLAPSIFNVANYRWIHAPGSLNGTQTAADLFAGAAPQRHGEHGVRIVRNFDTAAEKLGLSVRLASLPIGLEPYYSGVFREDRDDLFFKTERDWANQYAKYVS